MNYYGGIDIGSTTTEFIFINDRKEIIYKDKLLTSGNIRKVSNSIKERCSNNLNISMDDLNKVVATGYGRKQVEYAPKNITEISCYAKGAFFLMPGIRTIIDIGGQDSKVITLLDNGSVDDFVMNDKCAAGTGRFLEMVSKIFNIDVTQLGPLSLKAEKVFPISSICAVFAESEIISLISKDVQVEEIINSVHNSVGEKIVSMAARLKCQDDIMFCGGVARNSGMVKTLGRLLDTENLSTVPDSDFVGAIGAALFALESYS